MEMNNSARFAGASWAVALRISESPQEAAGRSPSVMCGAIIGLLLARDYPQDAAEMLTGLEPEMAAFFEALGDAEDITLTFVRQWREGVDG